MSEWKPIGTAPKNETCVLGWLPDKGVVLMMYTGEAPKRIYRWGWALTEASGLWPATWNEFVEPTHWMPLPGKPSP
jgi:hypothetical protein